MQALPTRGAFLESMASREDGLASVGTDYPPTLTMQRTNCPNSTGSLIQSPMVWFIIFLESCE